MEVSLTRVQRIVTLELEAMSWQYVCVVPKIAKGISPTILAFCIPEKYMLVLKYKFTIQMAFYFLLLCMFIHEWCVNYSSEEFPETEEGQSKEQSQRSSKLCQERLKRIKECFLLDGECLGGEAKHEADATRVVQSELYLLGPHIVVVGAGSQAASLTEICIFRLEMSMVPT